MIKQTIYCIAIALAIGCASKPCLGQMNQQELTNLIDAIITARESMTAYDFECVVSMEKEQGNNQYRYITRIQGPKRLYSFWDKDQLYQATTIYDGYSASHFGLGSKTTVRATLWHDEETGKKQIHHAVDPLTLGLLPFTDLSKISLADYFSPTSRETPLKLTAKPVEHAGIVDLLEIEMNSGSKAYLTVDPKSLRVHRFAQDYGTQTRPGFFEMDSTFSEDNTTVFPDHVIAVERDADDRIVFKTEWTVSKLDQNPSFDKDSFGLASLDLKIGEMVSVPATSSFKIWNGKELQNDWISTRIVAEVEKATAKPNSSYAWATPLLLLFSAIAAVSIGIRKYLQAKNK